MKRLLVTGASGFLGWNIIRKAKTDWVVFGTCFSHPTNIPDATLIQVDLTNFKDLKQLFDDIKPDAVVHGAAASDPNFCQDNPFETSRINTQVPIHIAGLCSESEIPCLFVSSDLVFDGLNPPYSEDDEPSPVNVYGEQKVKAELGIKTRYPKAVICRAALMYGEPGPVAKSFIQPLIHAITSGKAVNLFVDEYRTPLSGRHAAEGMMMALKHLPSVIHLGGLERVSRYEFGFLLAAILGVNRPNLIPAKQKAHTMTAPRPPDVSFDCTMAIALGFHPNSITDELEYLRGTCGWGSDKSL